MLAFCSYSNMLVPHAMTTVIKRKLTFKKDISIKTLGSTIDINSQPETIWENNERKIEQFPDPTIFKLLDIKAIKG